MSMITEKKADRFCGEGTRLGKFTTGVTAPAHASEPQVWTRLNLEKFFSETDRRGQEERGLADRWRMFTDIARLRALLHSGAPSKKTVRGLNESLAAELVERKKKASPKAVALLERWKDVPSVDPGLLRSDNERLFDSSL
jgi:hypothetical protein